MTDTVVLLDMGGVLVDLGTPAADMALPMSDAEFWRVWLGSEAVGEYETGRLALTEFCRRMGAEFGLAAGGFTAERLARWRLPLYPQVAATLRGLAGRYSLALLSNTNAMHWQAVRAQSDVFDAFSHVFLSYELGLHKPDRAIFEHVLDRLATPAADVVFIDDSERNVAAARELGIDAHRAAGFAEAQRVLAAQLAALGPEID